MKYRIESGDTLTGIAKKYDVTIKQILDANPKIQNPNVIFDGDEIEIPMTYGSFGNWAKSWWDWYVGLFNWK